MLIFFCQTSSNIGGGPPNQLRPPGPQISSYASGSPPAEIIELSVPSPTPSLHIPAHSPQDSAPVPTTTQKRSGSETPLPPPKKKTTKLRPPSRAKRLEASYKEVGAVAKVSSEAFIKEMEKFRTDKLADMEALKKNQTDLLATFQSVADSMRVKNELAKEALTLKKETEAREHALHEERVALERRKVEIGEEILKQIKKQNAGKDEDGEQKERDEDASF